MILDQAFTQLSALLPAIPAVERIVLNPCFTGVLLDSGHMGIAMNIRRGADQGAEAYRPLVGMDAMEASGVLADSEGYVAASIRTALCNALSRPFMEPEWLRGQGYAVDEDADSMMSGKGLEGKTVTIVGFGGNALPVSERAAKVYVTELEPELFRSTILDAQGATHGPTRLKVVHADQADRCFAEADLVLLTGCTLVTGSMERILALCPGKPVVLYGSTACFHPGTLFAHGVTTVATRVVEDPGLMCDLLANGGCMVERLFPRATRELTAQAMLEKQA